MLKNQEISIRETELDVLKKIPGVKFDLPFNEETYSLLVKLLGKPKTRSRKQGIYIFTHKIAGSKYVGSSYSLSRRLYQSFGSRHFNPQNTGLLIPLIKKEGFSPFNLEIKVMPPGLDTAYYYLFLVLETRYFLLPVHRTVILT